MVRKAVQRKNAARSTEYPHMLSADSMRIAPEFPSLPAHKFAHCPMAAMSDLDGGFVVDAQAFLPELFAEKVLLAQNECRRPQFFEVTEEHRAEDIAGSITLADFLSNIVMSLVRSVGEAPSQLRDSLDGH